MRLFLLSIISVIFSISLHGQAAFTLDDIPLSWRNFTKRDASVNSRVAAQTSITIDIDYELSNDDLVINLKVTQSRDQSWVSRQFLMKASDPESLRLLNHEKLHYVINLIGFKKIYNDMTDFKFTSDYKSEISSIFRKHTRDIDKMNSDYDRQTYHGTSFRNQSKWEEQIMSSFNQLYKDESKIPTGYTIRKKVE